MKIHKPSSRRFGLTLMELLIVLTILAVMATVAVQMTEGVVDQGRFDASQVGLERIRSAILSPEDATPGSAGFVADMGRLPVSRTELLVNPSTTPYSNAQEFDVDADGIMDVRLGSGWRGPYLSLPPGLTDLVDGWGRPYTFGVVGNVLTVQSPGSGASFTIQPQEFLTGLVKFHVREQNEEGIEVDPTLEAGEVLEMHLFEIMSVVDSSGETNNVVHETIRSDGTSAGSLKLKNNYVAESASRPMGRMAACAVVRENASPTAPVVRKTAVVYVNLMPRSDVIKKLFLPPGSPETPPPTP